MIQLKRNTILNCRTVFSHQVKLEARPNFHNQNFTTQCNYRIFSSLDRKRVNHSLNKANIYQYCDLNGAKLSSTHRIALLTEKKIKA